MDVLEASIARLREDSTLIALLQVVTNVHKGSAIKGGTELIRLGVAGDETSEPIIGHADGRNDLTFAEILEASFCKDSELTSRVSSCLIWVRRWENLGVMQKG